MGEKMRIDKFLSEMGEGTRSEVKTYIKKGFVSINSVIVKDPGAKLDVSSDEVVINGRTLKYEKFRYFMLNKPQGCVSATRDGLSSTVLDILSEEDTRDLFPVGRLDKDTEGFLLITNDGQLGHRLISPKKHVDKKYVAYVDTKLGAEQEKCFASGLDIGDEKPCLPAEICYIGESDEGEHIYEVVLREGRYHQVKRMFQAFGSEVKYLKRLSMGGLSLDESLSPGEYRRLTEEELELLEK